MAKYENTDTFTLETTFLLNIAGIFHAQIFFSHIWQWNRTRTSNPVIRNYFLVYQLISRFLLYLQNYKEFEDEILDLQSEKYGLSFDIKKYTTSD